MTSGFDSQTLADKLNKLNNSQQSIESLSSWCISHRKRAKQVVETWEKLFNSSPKEQKVSFLYLANDILQNSRRKGNEFVIEFWKVLPGALKNVYENGEDHGKNVVMRLVGIWDERKVFGSRGRSLKSDILGRESELPPLLDNNGKSSNSNTIKVVKKDAQTIRLKLAVGGMPEKIVTAYQSVLDEHFNEDTALNKCKASVHLVGRIAHDVDLALIQGNLQGSPLFNELQEQETILKQCIDQLRNVEATRASLIARLKEGLEEQESKLEHIHTQIQAAQCETEHVNNLRQKIGSAAATIPGPSPNTNHNLVIPVAMSVEATSITEANPALQMSNGPQVQPVQPVTSFTTSLTSTDEQHKKAAAAAMAAKLAASTSSAQMLTSVLSSLVAEEAASKNGSLSSSNITGSPPMFPAEKRPKLEKPMPNSDIGNTYFGHMPQQMGSVPLPMPPVPVSSMPPLLPNSHPLPPFPPPPPMQLLPPLPGQQFMQTSGGMAGVASFAFPGNPPLPPPPLPTSMGLARPGNLPPPPPPPPLPPLPPPQQQHQQQQQQQQQSQHHQQQSSPPGFYPSQGNGFYGQLQSGSPVPRQ